MNQPPEDSPDIHSHLSDPDVGLILARRMFERVRCEVELLASIAGSPRQARPLLRDLEITIDSFSAEDTRGIFLVIENAGEADGTPWTSARMISTAKKLLISLGCWDPQEQRCYATGSHWGDGSLVHLFCCCDFDAQIVRTCVDALKQRAHYGNL